MINKKVKFSDANYRRGYHHGYILAIENVRNYGIDMADAYEEDIARWRNKDSSYIIEPPEPEHIADIIEKEIARKEHD